MGAKFFINKGEGSDPGEAFDAVQYAVSEDYSHAGYTGSIIEKEPGEFEVIESTPLREDDAERLARELEEDPRVENKFGPAGAIAYISSTRRVAVTLAPEVSPDRLDQGQLVAAAGAALRRLNRLRDGESIQRVFAEFLSRRSLTVVINKPASELTPEALSNATPDGWVFFGWAAT